MNETVERAIREDALNVIFEAMKSYAEILKTQHFIFHQFGEDMDDLMCDIECF